MSAVGHMLALPHGHCFEPVRVRSMQSTELIGWACCCAACRSTGQRRCRRGLVLDGEGLPCNC